MDVQTWLVWLLGALFLGLCGGLLGGAVAANVTVRQTVAADQRSLQRMGAALDAARRDVVEASDVLRNVKAGQ